MRGGGRGERRMKGEGGKGGGKGKGGKGEGGKGEGRSRDKCENKEVRGRRHVNTAKCIFLFQPFLSTCTTHNTQSF